MKDFICRPLTLLSNLVAVVGGNEVKSEGYVYSCFWDCLVALDDMVSLVLD